MYHLLKKRHVAPQFGGPPPRTRRKGLPHYGGGSRHFPHRSRSQTRLREYHNVLAINSGCWQAQTDFQKSVNIEPDAGFAPIVDLDTLDVTVQKFS